VVVVEVVVEVEVEVKLLPPSEEKKHCF